MLIFMRVKKNIFWSYNLILNLLSSYAQVACYSRRQLCCELPRYVAWSSQTVTDGCRCVDTVDTWPRPSLSPSSRGRPYNSTCCATATLRRASCTDRLRHQRQHRHVAVERAGSTFLDVDLPTASSSPPSHVTSTNSRFV